jgi:hypothetical protein
MRGCGGIFVYATKGKNSLTIFSVTWLHKKRP